MKFREECLRIYDNMVTIKYEKIGSDKIYIHSITSLNKKQGNATKSLEHFITEFSGYDIYLYSSAELGTEKDILDRWYSKLGFKKCNRNDLPYNITHVLER